MMKRLRKILRVKIEAYRRARRVRRMMPPQPISVGVPIVGYVGVNGAGKTLLAASAVARDLWDGRTVYSTVPVVLPWGRTLPITSLRQLLELSGVTIFLDEVSVIFSSRSSQSLPNEIVTMLQTVRHKKNTIIWTAPAWMRCDNLLREVTQGVVNVTPLWRKGVKHDPWPVPRAVMAVLLDTSQGKADSMPDKRLRTRFALPRRQAAFGAYDTHADTPLLGKHVHSAVCVDCGGSESRPRHSKARHDALGLPWTLEDELAYSA